MDRADGGAGANALAGPKSGGLVREGLEDQGYAGFYHNTSVRTPPAHKFTDESFEGTARNAGVVIAIRQRLEGGLARPVAAETNGRGLVVSFPLADGREFRVIGTYGPQGAMAKDFLTKRS